MSILGRDAFVSSVRRFAASCASSGFSSPSNCLNVARSSFMQMVGEVAVTVAMRVSSLISAISPK